jgi:hypothetical protein
MKLEQIKQLNEQMTLDQAERWLEKARAEDRGPGMGRGTRENLRRAENTVRRLRQQSRRESGEVVTASFDVPEEIANDVHVKLHELWKGSPGFNVPWRTFYTDTPGMIEVRFQDYDPSNPKIKDLIAYVKSVSERR